MQQEFGKYKNAILLILILFISYIVFSNSLHNEFTNWDDDVLVLKNQYVLKFQVEGIMAFFTPAVLWRDPITLFSQAITFYFFKTNPVPYHLINLLLHLSSVVLLFVFISKITKKSNAALIACLLFAVHPFKVESVSWIAERKDVLYGFFFLLGLVSYVRYIEVGKKRFYFLAFLFAFLSYFSKTAGVMFPFIMVLIDYYYGRTFNRKLIYEKLPFFLVFISLGALHVAPALLAKYVPDINQTVSTGGFYKAYFQYNYVDRVFMGCFALVYYIIGFFAPISQNLIVPYPFKVDGYLESKYYLMPFVLLIMAFIVFLILRRKFAMKKDFIFGLSFFLVSISLVLHMIPMRGLSVAAERYSYIPYIGLFFIIGQFGSRLIERNFFNNILFRNIIITCFCGYLTFLCVKTFERNKIWKNSISLFTDVINKNPMLALGYLNRGIAKYDLQDYKSALTDLNIACLYVPNTPDVWYSRACIKHQMDDVKGAISDYSRTIELKTRHINAHLNRGILKMLIKDTVGARSDFFKVLAYEKNNPFALFNLGRMHVNQHKNDSAIFYLTKLENLKIVDPFIYYYRAQCHKKLWLKIKDLSKAIQIDSTLSNAYYERGLLKIESKNYYSALSDLSQSIELQLKQVAKTYFIFKDDKQIPIAESLINFNIAENRAFMFYNRGRINYFLGKKKEAVEDFTSSLKLNSINYDSYLHRGNARLEIKDIAGAIADFKTVLKLNPHKTEAYFGLGNAYYLSNLLDSSLKNFNKAIEMSEKPNSKLYSNRGNAKFCIKDYAGSIADNDKAIALEPKNADVYFNRGISKYYLKRKEDACKDFSKAADLGSQKAKDAMPKYCN